jgi:Protein of unknown function (DUF1064).
MGISINQLSQSAQKQALDKLMAQNRTAAPKGSKYHNQRTTRGNLTFDSKKEAQRFGELQILLIAGAIRNLKLQCDFTLQEAYTTPDGERVRAIRYKADFIYERESGPDAQRQACWKLVVEDVKSSATKTKDYIIKRKLMQERYGISIVEV